MHVTYSVSSQPTDGLYNACIAHDYYLSTVTRVSVAYCCYTAWRAFLVRSVKSFVVSLIKLYARLSMVSLQIFDFAL